MELVFNPFSVSLLLSGLLVGGMSLYIAIKIEDATRWIAMTMLCAAIWGFFYGLELSVSTLVAMMALLKLEYLGIAFLAPCWLIFSLKYTSYKSNKPGLLLGLILLIPVITYILVITNDYHYFYYESVKVISTGPFPTAKIEIGPWYLVNLFYIYFAYGLGSFIIWKRFKYSDPLFKTQTRIMLSAGLFPLVFNLFYQTHLFRPYEVIDLTPFSFLLTYLVLGFAVLKYQLFSLKPIARNKVMEAITKGVLVLDSEHKIVDFNPAFISSYSPSLKKIKVASKADAIFKNHGDILDLIAQQKAATIECHTVFGEKERILRIEAIPLVDKKEVASGLILLFDDITEQQAINQKLKDQASELQQLNNLKDKYFSIISHDLKGPVFGIKELIYHTNTGLISKDEFIEMLPEVSRNLEQVALLLENLLAWSSSQLRSGETVQFQEFDAHKILIQQKGILERIANEKKITIEIFPEAKSMVMADKNMIELVLRNIINNAIKFSPQGSKIKISTQDDQDFIKISIEDFGKGIPSENLSKIRGGISFTTTGQNNESGTGLGLLLVNEYIKKNKGKLEVNSEEGKGTLFCIRLPKINKKELA
ncbi:ATP-binding protein [Algoriphagus sp. AGSA1]|uniref:sensor histidine kinase n=1 Tax=Algoriphagus sp. AGSA1 TaxID=2907213 RepID=UPI001F375578|nr:histidine kinase N-terminal 7TM domain-containing protein [Algoriphagus sp. AGSA1]MCE7053553.1 ATP-binding protein [Algoriphagus sp. AGSA1]